jgi:hypothetical protein
MFIKYNFHYSFYENRVLPPFYRVKNRDSDQINESLDRHSKSELGVILLIPPYLNYTQKDLFPGYKCIQRTFWMGFAIQLPPQATSGEFLRNQLGKKPYKNLRQDIQRLERDYQIDFQTYFGSIEDSKYEFLMQTLKSFIQERFKGRTNKHSALNKWEQYEKSVRQMILNKKASIFVLLNKDIPICVSLNYHYHDIFVASIISFNNDFFSYSLGKQMFVKQIDWCYANNYSLIDLGWGSFDYKIKFSNAVFKYNTQIIYPEKSAVKYIISYFLGVFLYVKYYLVMIKQKKFKNPAKTYKGRWIRYSM